MQQEESALSLINYDTYNRSKNTDRGLFAHGPQLNGILCNQADDRPLPPLMPVGTATVPTTAIWRSTPVTSDRPVQWHDDGTVRPGHLVQLDPIQFDPGKFDDLLERKKIARRMRYLKRKKASWRGNRDNTTVTGVYIRLGARSFQKSSTSLTPPNGSQEEARNNLPSR